MPFGLGAALLYALTVVTAPLAYAAGASVVLLLCIRFASNVGLSVVADRPRGRLAQAGAGDVARVVGGSVALLGQTFALMSAVKALPISIAITVFFTFPVLNYLLQLIQRGRRPELTSLIAFAGAVTGVWLLTQGSGGTWSSAGIAWAVLASVMQAALNVVAGTVRGVDGWRMVRATSVVPLVVFGIWVAATAARPELEAVGWSLVSALCFGVGLYLFYRSVRVNGAVRTANLLYLEPVFAILLSLAIHDDALAPAQWTGVAMVAGATALIEWLERRRLHPLPEPPPSASSG